MLITEIKLFVEMAATIIGISGGLLGLYKYLSDKREKELRAWQKVVIYKIFRQNEMKTLSFTDILVKYRSEAQAFEDVDLKKKEVSENTLKRVLLELANSNVLSMEPSDSFRLKVAVEKPDPQDQLNMEKELREWQKVVIYKIFRQNEMKTLSFTDILVKYRSEAQASEAVDLEKKEISENTLRRVLLELANSNVLSMEPLDSFRLKVVIEKPDPVGQLYKVNQELVKMIGAPNGFIYTLDEVLKEIAPKVGIEIPLLRTSLKQSIAAGFFVVNEQGKIAFAR